VGRTSLHSEAVGMQIRGELVTLRPWRLDDVRALPGAANDPEVARYMNHRFPNPYTHEDARQWVAASVAASEQLHWAIEFDAQLAGGIGLTPGALEHAGSTMIGYWLGRRFWQRGLASDALRALTIHAFATPGLRPRRMWANVMSANAASARVLERAGYAHEATLRRAIVDRHGTAHDELIYVRFADGGAA
jgi:[ribosomal protein S5]-alanine N-acetyltransferase